MFHFFIGNPSISGGLSLKEVVSIHGFTFVNCVKSFGVHVSLLRDELNGALDL